jgi:hypothetical protein
MGAGGIVGRPGSDGDTFDETGGPNGSPFSFVQAGKPGGRLPPPRLCGEPMKNVLGKCLPLNDLQGRTGVDFPWGFR